MKLKPDKKFIERYLNLEYQLKKIEWNDENNTVDIYLTDKDHVVIYFDPINLDASIVDHSEITNDYPSNHFYYLKDQLNEFKYDAGINFIDAPDADIQKLYKYLDSFLENKKLLAKFLNKYHDYIKVLLPKMELDPIKWNQFLSKTSWIDKEGYTIHIDSENVAICKGDEFTSFNWSDSDE